MSLKKSEELQPKRFMDISTSQLSHTECDCNNREASKRLSQFNENEVKQLCIIMQEFHVKGCVHYGKPVAWAWPEIYKQWLHFAEEPTTESQLKTLWKNTKTCYKKFKELKEKSGWRWIEDTGTPVSTPELWDELIANNSDWSKFKDKLFPLFNIIDPILDATHAKGDLFRSSRILPLTSVPPCDLQVEEIGGQDDVKEDSTVHEAFNLTDLEHFPSDGLDAILAQGTFKEPIQNDSGIRLYICHVLHQNEHWN
ncbi:hypothetical protein AXF42_Ash012468 [Apostasia shenzhenica]|uniref:Myb/SANT-like domain-containing protein n=1 Tax=Apostasia shenzhenica TaxID=1088818 RepID=A0A2I0AQV4_9ASPA|nr:hypothetical protein AXF42_Ash012468 [Apostasia shenzhenica]